jgi:hypothetical protein
MERNTNPRSVFISGAPNAEALKNEAQRLESLSTARQQ